MRDKDQIVNNVCYFRLALQRPDSTVVPVYLNLLKIYHMKRGEWPLKYDPQQFGSANIRIECRSLGLKNVAALIFSTGKVVCPGPSSPSTGLIMAHVITSEISRVLGASFCMRNYQIPNLVGKIHTHPVDIATMAEVLGHAKARYEPYGTGGFPACFVFPHKDSIKKDEVVYLVFKSGKVVITGCRSEADVRSNQVEVRELCSHFPVRGPAPEAALPSALLAADRAMLGLPEARPGERQRLAIDARRAEGAFGDESYALEAPIAKRKRDGAAPRFIASGKKKRVDGMPIGSASELDA